MKLQQIRNATVIIDYADKRFLIDPMLSPKGTFPAFPGTVNDHLSNPLVELPIPMEEILAVDAVIVTHTHADHWDEPAKQLIPKNKPLFVQNERYAVDIRAEGFTDVRLLGADSEFDGIALIKTAGQHGSDEIMTWVHAPSRQAIKLESSTLPSRMARSYPSATRSCADSSGASPPAAPGSGAQNR